MLLIDEDIQTKFPMPIFLFIQTKWIQLVYFIFSLAWFDFFSPFHEIEDCTLIQK